MNRWVGVGRLTKNVEVKHTKSEIAVASFTIAINRPFKSPNGEYEADFINCIAWRQSAENLAKYCSKGDLIAVSGSVQTRSYDDNEGNRRFITEIQTDTITYLETNREKQEVEQSVAKVKEKAKHDVDDIESDLPF